MADSDSGLKILIEADASQASAELGKLNTAIGGVTGVQKENTKIAGEAGAAVTKLTGQKQELRRIISVLQHEFPLLGNAMRMALNPVVAVIMMVVSAMVGMINKVREFQAALDPGKYRAGAQGLEAYAVAAEQAQINSSKFAISLQSVESEQEKRKAVTDAALRRLDAEYQAVMKVLEARKQLALVGASPEEAAGIEAQFSGEGESARRAYADKKVVRMAAELGQTARRIPEAEQLAKEANAELEELRAKKAVLDRQRANTKENIEASSQRSVILGEKAREQGAFGYSMVPMLGATLAAKSWAAQEKEAATRENMKSLAAAQAQAALELETQIALKDRETSQKGSEVGKLKARHKELSDTLPEATASEVIERRANDQTANLRQLAGLKRVDKEQDERLVKAITELTKQISRDGKPLESLVAEVENLKRRNAQVEAKIAAMSTGGAFN